MATNLGGSAPQWQASVLPGMTTRLVIRYHWRMVSASTPLVDSDMADRVNSLAHQIATKAHEVLGDRARVIWFGSWVKGQARPHSDIDLAIMAAAPLPAGALARLRDWIDDLPTLYTIDLVNFDEASERMQQEILKDGIEIAPGAETRQLLERHSTAG